MVWLQISHKRSVTDPSVATLSVVVSILRIIRQEHLIPNLESIVDKEHGMVMFSSGLLQKAINSDSESLFLSTLEIACVHPK